MFPIAVWFVAYFTPAPIWAKKLVNTTSACDNHGIAFSICYVAQEFDFNITNASIYWGWPFAIDFEFFLECKMPRLILIPFASRVLPVVQILFFQSILVSQALTKF